MGALLRYFRDLDTAEEAFQDACLRALKNWPQNGPPRDPAAWLILSAETAASMPCASAPGRRRCRRKTRFPTWKMPRPMSPSGLDGAHYRDDILRLLFILLSSGPAGDAADRGGTAHRFGLTVKQIARAFLVGESAMEQRITRAKARIAEGGVPFETPGPVERSERLAAVAAMVYLIFNEGYSDQRRGGVRPGAALRGGDPAGPAVAAAVPRPSRRSWPDGAVASAACARTCPIRRKRRNRPARRAGSQPVESQNDRGGLALVDKALRHRSPGPYQVQAAIAALHARAEKAEDTDWVEIDLLYGLLEQICSHHPW